MPGVATVAEFQQSEREEETTASKGRTRSHFTLSAHRRFIHPQGFEQ